MRYHRRRRRYRRSNPGLVRGLPIPNLTDAAVAVAGGVGAKWVAKNVPVLNQATGFMQPLATLAAGIGLAFVLKAIRMGQFAKPVAMGAAVIAGVDLVKLSPLGAQLGEYYFPTGYQPAVGAGGVGNLPPGFMAQQNLEAGTEDDMSLFMSEGNLY